MAQINLNQTLNKIGRVNISRDINDSGNWLLKVPQQAITALNRSTAIGYGSSFDSGSDVTLYMVGGGTWAGVAGTAIGLFFGTGLHG